MTNRTKAIIAGAVVGAAATMVITGLVKRHIALAKLYQNARENLGTSFRG